MKNILKKLSWKAIIAGALTGGFLNLSVLISVRNLSSFFAFVNSPNPTPVFQTFIGILATTSFLSGITYSASGGFFTAIIARKHEMLNAFASFVLTILFVELFVVIAGTRLLLKLPYWYLPLAYVVTPFAYLLGGYFGLRYNRQNK